MNLGVIPDGQRIYAIGDIHGRADLLVHLLDIIQAYDFRQKDVEQRKLVFLGDYIDRGPDSQEVVNILLNGLPSGFEGVFLKGNHEDMMLDALGNEQAIPTWFHNGGEATLESYGVNMSDFTTGSAGLKKMSEGLYIQLPNAHKEFFRRLKISETFGDYFFVHAGVNPRYPLNMQKEQDMLWVRDPFLNHDNPFEKIIVHGHTISKTPEKRANRIGLDTGAFRTGRLTAVCLEQTSSEFLST